ncbi:retrovirus-related pol polyprotein from transposon TNT 1-94 [Tanacetum coccineum]
MSTSKTYQQSLADASSETRPPMLERGSYIPWASRFRRYINRKRENRKWLNKALDEGPYQFEMFIPKNSTVPKLQTAEDLQGDALLHYDAEMKLMNLILLLHYDAEMELMNLILLSIPNDIYNSVMLALRQGHQFEKLVNVSRAKKLEKSHDPLALVAHTGSSSRNTSYYYVTHPTSVVDYEDELPEDENSGNGGRNNRRAYIQEEIVEGSNTPNETGNVQRTLRTSSSGNTSTVQCYNCSGKEHYARNCPKPRVHDSKYFMEQILLANQDEAGVILYDGNSEISLNIRDTEDTLDDASKSQQKRDIKEMKDVFESTESELCELEKQTDFLKDRLLEVSLKHEVELSVLLIHECVENSLHDEIEELKKKSIEIQEGLQARIKNS